MAYKQVAPLLTHVCVCSNTFAFVVFLLAQILHGIGQSCVYTLAPAHINANAAPDDAAMLVAYIYGTGPMGMALGFMIIGGTLKNGTWWTCFAFTGVLCLLLAPLVGRLPAVPDKHKESAVMNSIRRPSMMSSTRSSSENRSARSGNKVAPASGSSNVSAQRRPSSLGTITVQEFHAMDFRTQVRESELASAERATDFSTHCPATHCRSGSYVTHFKMIYLLTRVYGRSKKS